MQGEYAGEVRVLGIDPGSLITGFGCVEGEARGAGVARVGGAEDVRVVDGGVIRLKREWVLADRLVQLHEDVRGLLSTLKPDVMAVEAIFTHVERPASVIVMGHARGVILLAARQASVPIRELRPAEVKRAIAGHGQAKKAQIQRAIAAELGLDTESAPADMADALAVALCALRRARVDVDLS